MNELEKQWERRVFKRQGEDIENTVETKMRFCVF